MLNRPFTLLIGLVTGVVAGIVTRLLVISHLRDQLTNQSNCPTGLPVDPQSGTNLCEYLSHADEVFVNTIGLITAAIAALLVFILVFLFTSDSRR